MTFAKEMAGLICLVSAMCLVAVPVTEAQQCVGDADGNDRVTINELVTAVRNALDGCGASTGLVAVSGTISSSNNDRFRVWATGDKGAVHQTETSPDSGRFTIHLPPDDWYVIGFGHFHGHAQMHFAGNMVFPCELGEDDHMFIAEGGPTIDLGMVVVDDDGSFARPQHNPLDQLDHDGDGIPDRDDGDMHCEDVGDRDHDGFYDDDRDHDGFHDDDADHDGHRDDGHPGGRHSDDEVDGGHHHGRPRVQR